MNRKTDLLLRRSSGELGGAEQSALDPGTPLARAFTEQTQYSVTTAKTAQMFTFIFIK
jgi:hypothetical protein